MFNCFSQTYVMPMMYMCMLRWCQCNVMIHSVNIRGFYLIIYRDGICPSLDVWSSMFRCWFVELLCNVLMCEFVFLSFSCCMVSCFRIWLLFRVGSLEKHNDLRSDVNLWTLTMIVTLLVPIGSWNLVLIWRMCLHVCFGASCCYCRYDYGSIEFFFVLTWCMRTYLVTELSYWMDFWSRTYVSWWRIYVVECESLLLNCNWFWLSLS